MSKHRFLSLFTHYGHVILHLVYNVSDADIIFDSTHILCIGVAGLFWLYLDYIYLLKMKSSVLRYCKF